MFINRRYSYWIMEIYEPAEDSYLLQKFVRKYACGRVLDLGTGSGIQALTALENPKVKKIVAVDVNREAIEQLQKKIKNDKLTAAISDLFENVKGQFDFIVFNPPYLPQDKGVSDEAIYGGKKGWEISQRFFMHVSKYLFPEGRILFLFSSLTDKMKIEEIISHNLLQFKELGTEKISFEELYVYEITKTPLLKNLESKNITDINYFTHGKRGDIFTGTFSKSVSKNVSGIKSLKKSSEPTINEIKVAVKVKRKESKADGRIENEANWLKLLNKRKIGPKLLFHEKDYLVCQFAEGDFILQWIARSRGAKQKKAISKILNDILEQCFVMDKLGINKEEMHHPLKHIIIDKNNLPTLLDFERCSKTKKPKNVTQFIEFICRFKEEFEKKDFMVNVEKLRELAKEYKHEISKQSLEMIKNEITSG